jgi:hypothetical protein
MAYDPVSTGIAAGGAFANLLSGRSAANAQKEQMRRQAQTIGMQNQNFRAAQPYWEPLLQQYAARAGLQTSPGVTQTGANQFSLSPTGTNNRAQFGMGGQFGSYEDQLRLREEEEGINRWLREQGSRLAHQAGLQGMGEGTRAAMLRGIQSDAGQQYGQFRRGLAINAGQDQERRMAQLQQLLGMGFGQGSQAAAGYGQQAGVYGGQAAAANQGLGNIVSNWQYMNALQQGQQPIGGGGIDQAELLRLLAQQGQGGGTMDTYGGGYGGRF